MLSSIFVSQAIDVPDGDEIAWKGNKKNLWGLIGGSESDERQRIVLNQNSDHKVRETTDGLIYAILSTDDDVLSSSLMNDLLVTQVDSFYAAKSFLRFLIVEKFHKMKNDPKTRLLQLLTLLVKKRVTGIGEVLSHLFRFFKSGTKEGNIWLICSLLEIVTVNSDWLYQKENEVLLKMSFYSFLSVINLQKSHKSLGSLVEKEVNYCHDVLKKRLNVVVTIGRDVLRLMYDLGTSFPLLSGFFKSISKSNNGPVIQMMRPTDRSVLINRLSPQLERKLHFVMTQVRLGKEKRYQDWIYTKFVRNKEDHGILVDSIRYICTVFYPSNKQMNAGLTPRYAMCGWILATIMKNAKMMEKSAVMAILFDLLCFAPKVDHVMNIEPVMLFLQRSLRPELLGMVDVTLSKLFSIVLSDSSSKFSSLYVSSDFLRNNVKQAFSTVVEMKVVRSLDLISKHVLIRKKFEVSFQKMLSDKPETLVEVIPEQKVKVKKKKVNLVNDLKKKYSSEEFERIKMLLGGQKLTKENVVAVETKKVGRGEAYEKLKKSIETFPELKKVFEPHMSYFCQNITKNVVKSKEALDSMLELYHTKELDIKLASSLASFLSCSFSIEFSKDVESDVHGLMGSLIDLEKTVFYSFVFTIHKHCNGTRKGVSEVKERFGELIKQLIMHDGSFGYRLLCYCVNRKRTTFYKLMEESFFSQLFSMLENKKEWKDKLIKQFITSSENFSTNIVAKFTELVKYFVFYKWTLGIRKEKNTTKSLIKDLERCYQDNPSLFFVTLPVYTLVFGRELCNNPQFLRIVVRNSYPKQIKEICNLISLSKLEFEDVELQKYLYSTCHDLKDDIRIDLEHHPVTMINIYDEKRFITLVRESLSWESFEQFFLWDIILAEFSRTSLLPPKHCIKIAELLLGLVRIRGSGNGANSSHHDYLFKLVYLFTESSLEKFIKPSYDLFFNLLTLHPHQFGLFTVVFLYKWINGNIKSREEAFKRMLVKILTELFEKHEFSSRESMNELYSLKAADGIISNLVLLKSKLWKPLNNDQIIEKLNMLKRKPFVTPEVLTKLTKKSRKRFRNYYEKEEVVHLSSDEEDGDFKNEKRKKRRRVEIKET